MDPGSSLLFVSLDDRCHPPTECQCWIVFDPAHRSGIAQDIGGWHRPKTTKQFMYAFSPGPYFAIVDVKRLDAKAYSVLGCPVDWGALKPM